MAVATGTAIALGAAAGLVGSAMGARAQTSAANQANGTLQNQQNQAQWNSQPYQNAGQGAVGSLAWLLGIGDPNSSYKTQQNFDANAYLAANPDAQQWIANNQKDGHYVTAWDHYLADGAKRDGNFWKTTDAGKLFGGSGSYGSLLKPFSQSNFQVDPGYEFRLSEGQKALERSAAAKGMSLSGSQLKALTGYNQNFASNEYNNAYTRYNNDQTTIFNRLSGLSGTGQQANQLVGQLGSNMANQVGQNQLGAGNATAAGWIGGTNAIGNGINTWNNWNMWNSMMNQGSAQRAYDAWRAQGPVPYATGG